MRNHDYYRKEAAKSNLVYEVSSLFRKWKRRRKQRSLETIGTHNDQAFVIPRIL